MLHRWTYSVVATRFTWLMENCLSTDEAETTMDDAYKKKLAARIDAYMSDLGLTYEQAFNKARKQVKLPNVVVCL